MFLTHMKALFFTLAIAALFFSCSPYQKILRSDDVGLKFHYADSLYNAGKYKKALKLMEQIVPAYRGKPQAEKLMFLYSDTFYNLGDYYLSGYQFERFVSSYPTSQKIEDAAFKGAKSYYYVSPRYSLDQKDTYIALEKLQGFINRYPDSQLLSEANVLVSELTEKLQKKEFEVAKQYNRIYDYKAAIASFDNFIINNPGSKFREEAFYLKFESAYQLAIRSVSRLVEERLNNAKTFHENFIKYFPNSSFKAEADAMLEDINQRLENKQV